MSSIRTISNTFTVTTMDDPVSVQAQYSPDMVTIGKMATFTCVLSNPMKLLGQVGIR